MSSSVTARNAFPIAIGLLLVCAVLVYSTLTNFSRSQRAVEHSQQVRELLGETESDIATAARLRLIYVLNGDSDSYVQYEHSVSQIPVVLKELRRITADNAVQQNNCDRLETAVNTRIELWEKSVALRRSGVPEPAGQPQMTRQSLEFANDIVTVTRAMGDEENRLLKERAQSAHVHFVLAIVVIIGTFTSAVLLLLWHYKLLRGQLRAREQAEMAAVQSERKAHEAERAAVAGREAVGQLSARLLKSQDDERRRFSRELHDSIGQYLAATKMTLSGLAGAEEVDSRYAECIRLLDQSIKEIRTLSHLLHPPGLDEAGFSSAARWYAEEFGKRSGLELKLDIPELPERLPAVLELALFRVLQESLTNIHRHAKSKAAEVTFRVIAGQATLAITDQGRGIPDEVLDRFRVAATSGVGLGGMRERVRELGGRFEVESSNQGTSVRVTVPVSQVKPRSQQSSEAFDVQAFAAGPEK
ncbi:MAG TPA: CHASE3 domain-containing protein [Terriglobales bacterium]|nr:CHASE3 domain-containing protein [Terriglobales bacterium]